MIRLFLKLLQAIALYARVSTQGQKADLERQVERLKTYAASKGYQVSKCVQEIASGMNDNRPELSKLLTDSHTGVIVVEHRDRLLISAKRSKENKRRVDTKRYEQKIDTSSKLARRTTDACLGTA